MPVPVISVSQMRDWEKAAWSAGVSTADVIEKVGRLIAQRLLQLTRPNQSILILAGQGHNGDDARAAAAHLPKRLVSLLDVQDPDEAREELARAIARQRPHWILDGLFGIGLNRPLSQSWIDFLHQINSLDLPVLSIDTPSGLNVETGEIEGAAVHATFTLAVGAPKLGLISPRVAPYVGRLEILPEIGLVPSRLTAEMNWTMETDFDNFPPRRPVESHKGVFGHVALFAGSLGYHGAAVLATLAAQRAQPGLVTLWTHPAVYNPVAAQLRAAMVHPWKTGLALSDSVSAILAGPGLAANDLDDNYKNEIRSLWLESSLPVIIDATALDWLPSGPTPRHAIRVITPHPGEAARLLGIPVEDVQANRPANLRALSQRHGDCWVVLKGRHTLIGKSTGDIFINSSGNPFLAQGGSGDVLAGFLSGLLAQTPFQATLMKTLRFGVWEHGHIADRLNETRKNWTPEDLINELGNSASRVSATGLF